MTLTTDIANFAFNAGGINTSGFKRNRIINGNMLIDQRNAGASVTPTSDGTYLVDRFKSGNTQASKLTFQQSTTAPTGFSTSLKATVAAVPTIASTDYFFIQQKIEGYNIYDLGLGSSSANALVLSFWVQSSVIGTYGVTLRSGDETLYYNFGYTITTANTWQKVTQYISAPTTGGTTAFPITTSAGIEVWFGLGYGTTFVGGTQNAWTSGFVGQPTGSINFVSNSAATWYITGVQLEVGSIATPYERQMYSDQLNQCQRYYVGAKDYYFTVGYDSSYTSQNSGGMSWEYQMRAVPSIVINSGGMDGHHGVPPTLRAGPVINGVSFIYSGSGLRNGANCPAYVNFSLSAEL